MDGDMSQGASGDASPTYEDSRSSKVLISGLPLHVRFDNIEPLLSQYGNVQHCDKANSRDANAQAVFITFESPEQAQQAINGLNGCELEGSRIKVEAAEQNARGGRRGRPGGGRGGGGAPGGGSRPTDFPLRLLVQSDMVGAIIGRQGSTIRLITQQSRARVDVHRKDNVGSLEKAITIYGNPENCTNACKRILEVMQQEANNTNKGEICLKILAHNNLIGRIIGKGGNTIKRIMQETDTKITVSSINDINSFNLERIITVKGSIENMAKAESQISAKLRQSYENDLQVLAPQSIMFPGLHPMAMMSTGRGFCGAPPPFPPPIYAPLAGQGGAQQGAGDSQETTYLYIPNNAVGAIIGTKGSHIRNIIRFSTASVKIAPLEQDKQGENQNAQQERKVTIVGTPEAQWKAQYLIFEKMREEGFMSGSDDVRLTVEIVVASSQVGRIIGKGGQNVRELQRVTGSLIKLPEQPQQQGTQQQDHDTTVHIVGAFYSVQHRDPAAARVLVGERAAGVPRHRRRVLRAGVRLGARRRRPGLRRRRRGRLPRGRRGQRDRQHRPLGRRLLHLHRLPEPGELLRGRGDRDRRAPRPHHVHPRLRRQGEQAVPERQGAERGVVLAAAVGARVPDGGDARRLRGGGPRAADGAARAPHARGALPREAGLQAAGAGGVHGARAPLRAGAGAGRAGARAPAGRGGGGGGGGGGCAGAVALGGRALGAPRRRRRRRRRRRPHQALLPARRGLQRAAALRRQHRRQGAAARGGARVARAGRRQHRVRGALHAQRARRLPAAAARQEQAARGGLLRQVVHPVADVGSGEAVAGVGRRHRQEVGPVAGRPAAVREPLPGVRGVPGAGGVPARVRARAQRGHGAGAPRLADEQRREEPARREGARPRRPRRPRRPLRPRRPRAPRAPERGGREGRGGPGAAAERGRAAALHGADRRDREGDRGHLFGRPRAGGHRQNGERGGAGPVGLIHKCN